MDKIKLKLKMCSAPLCFRRHKGILTVTSQVGPELSMQMPFCVKHGENAYRNINTAQERKFDG